VQDESRHHAPVAAFSFQPWHVCADIFLLGILGPSANTQRRRAIIFRSGGVVLFRIALYENEREHTKTGKRDRDEETTGNEVIKCPHCANPVV
jgi:hypothetical protein